MSTLTVGTISEKVTDAGVAVDGVTLKDGGATFTSAVGVTGNTTITSVNLVIGTSGNGIDFSANADSSATGATMTSELLDDYEEGTFIPLCNFSSATPPAGKTAGKGQYTKIGRQVHCHFLLTNINVTGASGDIQIQNMPFTVLPDSGDGAVANYVGVAKANFINFAGSTFLNSVTADNTSNCKITECTDNATSDTITASNCTDGTTDIQVSISYPTAS